MSQSTILKAAEQYAEERLRDLFEKLEIDEDERKRFLEANTELRKRNVNTRGRNRRAKRDPNAPKKPLNAYMHFARDESVREGIKKKNKDINQKELTVKLGERWKEMNEKEKKAFVALAEKDKERYQAEMADYKPEAASSGSSSSSSKKDKKADKTEKSNKKDKKAEKAEKAEKPAAEESSGKKGKAGKAGKAK